MKKINFLLVLIHVFILGKSQCDSVLNHDVDKFTGKKSITSNGKVFYNDGKTLVVMVGIVKQYVSLGLATTKGCVNDWAPVTLLFSDGSKITITSDLSFNCNASAKISFNMKFQKKEIAKLATVKLSAVRIRQMDGNFDYDFTDAQSSELADLMGCIQNEIK